MSQREHQSIYKREQGKIQKPDVYGIKKRKMRTILQKLEQEDREDEFDQIQDAFTEIVDSDAIAAAKFLIQHLPPAMPPVCFVHQLYNILPNNTIVDKEIQDAVKLGTWRKIHILGQLEDEALLIQTHEYCRMIEESKKPNDDDINKTLDAFKQIIIDPQYNQISIKKSVLLEHKITEKQMGYLLSEGFLLPHTQLDAFWFTVKKQGQFMSNITAGRAEILRILKKRASKDIILSLLKNKRLRKTRFDHDFLLHDLIGSGRVEKFTKLGNLIRLTNKGAKLV